MTQRYIQFNLNRDNTYISGLTDIGDSKYTFVIRWDEDYDYFTMDIQDLSGEYIISGVALVNNLLIRNVKLPYVFYFTHLNDDIYEPTIDNITEFGLVYEDGK